MSRKIAIVLLAVYSTTCAVAQYKTSTTEASPPPATMTFAPTFTILWRSSDPSFKLKKDPTTAYAVPVWKSTTGKETFNLFNAAESVTLSASRTEQTSTGTRWIFPDHPSFALEAEASGGEMDGRRITYRFTPKQKAWYSVGYTGAPEMAPGKLEGLWQPHVWQERRFPEQPFLSVENMCSLPAVLAQRDGITYGVVADPAEGPFRLPTTRNSRYGVMLRNAGGQAQPAIFAPVLGGAESQMDPGHTYSFKFHLVNKPGNCTDAFRILARELFEFRDYRENVGCSLNQTLENMVDFAMNDALSGWIADLRASDYTTDVPGAVKNVSALHPLSIALVTDNADIYRRRALPMMEYLLSRQKYLFATREDITGQGASYYLRGPAAEVSELAALYLVTGRRNEVFRHYAHDLYDKPRALNLNMVSEGASWQNSLALYRLTNDRSYLERAVDGANAYIARRVDVPQADFSDAHVDTGGQFWTDYAPKWVDLMELYEETKDPRHLKAALAGASSYSTYVWMHPRIPHDQVLINPGGQLPVHNKRQIVDPQPMRAAEQLLPAWQVSQIGLTPEASRTHQENPAIMLTHYAAYMLRAGYASKDDFLRDIARSAVVGRYQNFPGYDINGEFTNVYSRPDYPLRAYRELTYNNIYYNHIWPHIALLMDYLISDAYVKSNGQIDFPSRYAQGYAFLSSKVYGDRTGSFYGDKNVHLWMPREVISTDNIQLNYVVGYGNEQLYLACMNQSAREQHAVITLNPGLIPLNSGSTYNARAWIDNAPASPAKMKDGKIELVASPNGITAIAVDGISITTQFQELAETTSSQTGADSLQFRDTPVGRVTSMLISMGDELTNVYTWLEATPRQVARVELTCKANDKETTAVDIGYPFECSLPLPKATSHATELRMDLVTTAGETIHVEPILLR